VRILIVGAGISGSTLASLIEDINEVEVIDKGDHIAGNCFDYISNSIMVHMYGSHIFHTTDEGVWRHLCKYANFNTYMHKVLALVEGQEVPLPFNFNTIREVFPELLADEIERKLLEMFEFGTKIPIMDLIKTDDELLKFLADYVFENVYLHYTEKQWGKSPNDIDGAVTARVPIYLCRDNRYFQDRYQGIPIGGYTEMIKKMMDRPNVVVKLNTPFNSIADIEKYDHIFYTGPIDELMDYCFGPLPYRSIRLELEEYDCEYYQENAVVNYPNNYDFTRIHEYKYYLNDKSNNTIIAKEYPEEFIPGKNERFYPIPTENNIALYKRYLDSAKKRYPNMHFLGRLGDYKYYDMDKAVKRAMEVYKEVFGN